MSWSPTSACGSACLPPIATLPRVSRPVQVWRVLALGAVVAAGLGAVLVMPLLTATGRARLLRGWFRAVVTSVGARIAVSGTAAHGPALVAANHVSWLDVPAILAVQPMRVVAKSEVRHWPVLGLLATRGGTLYIDRNRLRRLPTTVADIATALRRGHSVMVFPEGSTWCGGSGRHVNEPTMRRVRPATMQSAIDAGVAVQPVALQYQLADGTPTTVAAFVGTDNMLASAWRIAGTRGLVVDVNLGPPVDTVGRTRRQAAAAVGAWIGTAEPRLRAPRARRAVARVRKPPVRGDFRHRRRLVLTRRAR